MAPIAPLKARSHPQQITGSTGQCGGGPARAQPRGGSQGFVLKPCRRPRQRAADSRGMRPFPMAGPPFVQVPSTLRVIPQTCPAETGGQKRAWLPVSLNGLNGSWARS